MKLDLLHPEPDLEFGGGGRCVDIRFGIGHYGVFDFSDPKGPRKIKLGLIGTNETIQGLTEWFEKCQNEIPGKPNSQQPRLFPPFPGFSPTHSFHSQLVWDSNEFRTVEIPDRIVNAAHITNEIIKEVVDLYIEEIAYLLEKSKVDILICAPSLDHLKITSAKIEFDEDDGDDDQKKSTQSKHDFHDLLKAEALRFWTPIQIVLPATYDESKLKSQKEYLNRDQQDEATRAWNIHTALYYKAGGVPWRMIRSSSDLSTCYLGISFFKTLDKERVYASSAQVFNERGEGVVVRGGLAYENKPDRQIYLDENGAYNLLSLALQAYRNEHGNFPARVVLHKTSPISEPEDKGFTRALWEKHIDKWDILHVKESYHRLFRTEDYSTLRGTFWQLEDRKAILYTRGSIYFYETYPGKYPPLSVYMHRFKAQKSLKDLAFECMALSKMNWNTTRFDGHLPITLRAAKQVGSIFKYLEGVETSKIPPSYRFYM